MDLVTTRTRKAREEAVMQRNFHDDKDPEAIGAPTPLDLYFDADSGIQWVGAGARWIKHLEVIMPMDLRAAQVLFMSCTDAASATIFLFNGISRAYPLLESLTVRVTTSPMSNHDVAFPDEAGRVCYASNRPDLVVGRFEPRVCSILVAAEAHRSPNLKSKEVVFFQKLERQWQEWRDGPLGQPLMKLEHSDFESEDMHVLLWQMMDPPSCRLRF